MDLIDRQATIKTIQWWFGILDQNPDILIDSIIQLPSIQPEIMPENEFLDFLWNVINPNDMEQYLSMYHSKEEKQNG